MNWKESLKKYEPINEQESADKISMCNLLSNFDDILTRKNTIAHITCSSLAFNKSHDKVLMVYHNIYDNWSLPGGHADGEENFLDVAIKEIKEETGVKNIRVVNKNIISLDILPVKSHIKNGKFISSHLHISLVYLLEVDENENLRVKEDENSDVRWIDVNTVLDITKKEPHMQAVYKKILSRNK